MVIRRRMEHQLHRETQSPVGGPGRARGVWVTTVAFAVLVYYLMSLRAGIGTEAVEVGDRR